MLYLYVIFLYYICDVDQSFCNKIYFWFYAVCDTEFSLFVFLTVVCTIMFVINPSVDYHYNNLCMVLPIILIFTYTILINDTYLNITFPICYFLSVIKPLIKLSNFFKVIISSLKFKFCVLMVEVFFIHRYRKGNY